MIAYVSGILKDIEEQSAVVDVGGIGYRVYTPVTEELVRVGVGNPITLYTYMSVREDAQQLFGFLKKSTLKLFQQLITVSDVGAKAGLAILTQLPADTVVYAIAGGDYKTLTKVSGIGNKKAQRIVLELKDKVGIPSAEIPGDAAGAPSSVSTAEKGVKGEVIAALESLGYSRTEIMQILSNVPTEGRTAEAVVKDVLKQLAVF